MLVLDLDDTVVPHACKSAACVRRQVERVKELLDYCDENGIDVARNTARSSSSLAGVADELVARLKHRASCHRPPGTLEDVPTHKARCMARLARGRDRSKVVLMDDRSDVCRRVRQDGFGAIHVTGYGISDANVALFKEQMHAARFQRYRPGGVSGWLKQTPPS